MSSFAITVVGHDKPGIIAAVTKALAEHGGNVEDSTMTLLRGHFAWTLLVSVEADQTEIEESVAPFASDDLSVTVLPMPEAGHDDLGAHASYWVNVHGADRPGIVATLTGALADQGGNITNLSTRLVNDMYVLGIDIDLPQSVDADAVAATLTSLASDLGVSLSMNAADEDVL